MPAGRVQKTRAPRDVPDLGNPDRKRVLNVLAQRRYRQRRKEKIATLEAQAKGLEALVEVQSMSSDSVSPNVSKSPDVSISPGDDEAVEEIIPVPSADELSGYAIHEDPFNMSLMEDFCDFSTLPTTLSSSPDLVESQQGTSPIGFSFPLSPDSGSLPLPILSMVQAFISIGTALNVCDNLWDPCYMHVMPASAPCLSLMPANLQPVPAQLMIPHHPALDLLPWPSMREKLICMLALPNKLRPPIAREDDEGGTDGCGIWPGSDMFGNSTPAGQSKAIVQLVQDLDDFEDGGGLRVHGNSTTWGQGSEFVDEAWEVGESFYRKWWFCLDQKIIDQTNQRRNARGMRRLRLAPAA